MRGTGGREKENKNRKPGAKKGREHVHLFLLIVTVRLSPRTRSFQLLLMKTNVYPDWILPI